MADITSPRNLNPARRHRRYPRVVRRARHNSYRVKRPGDTGTHYHGPPTIRSWEDDGAFYLPWRFDLADIRAPVGLWHGLKDFLPVAHAHWLTDRIPHVTAHFPADEDHTNIEENNRAAAFAWLKDQL